MSLRSKPQKSVHPGRTQGLLLQRTRRAWTARALVKEILCRFAPNRCRALIWLRLRLLLQRAPTPSREHRACWGPRARRAWTARALV